MSPGSIRIVEVSRNPLGRRAAIVCAATVALFVAPAAFAQTVSNVAIGGQPAKTNLTFTGNVQSSVMMTISGKNTTTLTDTSQTKNTTAVGTIDFGTVSALGPLTATNGKMYRATSGTPGVILVADVTVSLIYNGVTTGSVLVSRQSPAGGAPDIPLANLRVASPPLASWSSQTDAPAVPDSGQPGYDLCTANGRDTTCQDGVAYDHQLAVFIPVSQLPGTFTTVVLYSGTAP